MSHLVKLMLRLASGRGDRLEVWVRDIKRMKRSVGRGRKVKNKLKLDASRKIKFASKRTRRE